MLGSHHLGIELIDKRCWKCGHRLFVISGVVTTEPECDGWSRSQWSAGNWQIRDFYALYQLNDGPAHQLAAVVAELVAAAGDWLTRNQVLFASLERRFIKNAGQELWTSYCPNCRATDGPAKLIEIERPRLIAKWRDNVLAQKFIYRNATIQFDVRQPTYNDIKGHQVLHRRIEGR